MSQALPTFVKVPRISGFIEPETDPEASLIKKRRAFPRCEFDVLVSKHLWEKQSQVSCEMLGVLLACYPVIWLRVLMHLPGSHWLFRTSQNVHVTIGLVSNPDIQILNQQYRQKNEATDVLSFPIHDDSSNVIGLFPLLDLGEVDVSLDWALSNSTIETFEPYVLERVIHGTLHILGIHHDTLSAYNKVVAIQADILGDLVAHLADIRAQG